MTTATQGRPTPPSATICVRRQQVHRKSQHPAERLINENRVKEGIRGQLTIQSDRGSAIRSQAVAQAGHRWGDQVLSRPHVSDDGPLSESQFKTLKYRPAFPDRFASHDHGLDFCRGFFHWHNEEHQHRGIGLLAPTIVHTGRGPAAIEAQASVLVAFPTRHHERFIRGVPRLRAPAAEVWIHQPERKSANSPHT